MTTTYIRRSSRPELLPPRRFGVPAPHIVLWAEDEAAVEHYGQYRFTLRSELPAAAESADLIAFAAEYFGVDLDEAAELVNPDDIVDTAQAWDNAEFVSELWQAMERGQVEMTGGYRTWDGAVTFPDCAAFDGPERGRFASPTPALRRMWAAAVCRDERGRFASPTPALRRMWAAARAANLALFEAQGRRTRRAIGAEMWRDDEGQIRQGLTDDERRALHNSRAFGLA